MENFRNTAMDFNKDSDILEKLKKGSEKSIFRNHEATTDKKKMFVESSPVVKLADYLIFQAISMGTSDIHMEPFENSVLIRFRIDGILQEYTNLSREIYLSVCSRIKLQSNMDIAEKRLPQDGKMQFYNGSKCYDLRISTLPTIFGEKIAIRVLYKHDKLLKLEDLGFLSDHASFIRKALKQDHGIILVTGPTGCGKTTTLYSMLEEIDKKNNNIVTLEDPIEIPVEGVNQVNVNSRSGLSFASGLRSILRQDPNIILLGEIRDEETAQIAVRAAITGHLVISTLHTNDAASSIIRLVDMGVPSYLVADSMIMCIAQRLVRRICPKCRVEYVPCSEECESLGIPRGNKIFMSKGCSFCSNTGYKGRTVLCEIMEVDNNIRRLITQGNSVNELREYNNKKGMTNLMKNRQELVKKGITTFQECMKEV